MPSVRHWQSEPTAAHLKVKVEELIVHNLCLSIDAALGRHKARRRRARQEPICLRACVHSYFLVTQYNFKDGRWTWRIP